MKPNVLNSAVVAVLAAVLTVWSVGPGTSATRVGSSPPLAGGVPMCPGSLKDVGSALLARLLSAGLPTHTLWLALGLCGVANVDVVDLAVERKRRAVVVVE